MLLIKDGTIIDGSGKLRFQADISIENGKIVKIGTDLDDKGESLDASNKIVCPGFIDIHSHFDFTYPVDPLATDSVLQGITTELAGNCGLGLAPANPVVVSYYKDFARFVFGEVEIEPFPTIADYINHISKQGCSLNVALLIPHGNVKLAVMKLEDRSPTVTELEEMREIVAREMKNGAYGLSTGLVYPPGSITQTNEIIELCKTVCEYEGIYTSHIRDEGQKVIESMQEAITIGEQSGAPVQISHIKVAEAFQSKTALKMLDLFHDTRKSGLDLTADVYPYTAGSSSLAAYLQPWVIEGGVEAFVQRLSDPILRKRIIKEFKEFIWSYAGIPKYLRFIPKSLMLRLIIHFLTKRVIISNATINKEFEGLTLREALKRFYPSKGATEGTLDLLRDERGGVLVTMIITKEKNVITFIKDPDIMFSTDNLATKGGIPHPRVCGTYPRILGRCVREHQLLTLEEAIRKSTSFPAKRLGLSDRGLIKPEYWADIVIFDPQIIRDTATHSAKGAPEGIDYVIVNGVVTVNHGVHTQEKAGVVLKHRAGESKS